MKKALVALVIAALLLTAVPAMAGDVVGNRISLHPATGCNDALTYSADTYFYVNHGWGGATGFATFNLYIEGAQVRGGRRAVTIESTKPLVRTVMLTYTFPDGMPAGTYLFTGEWLARDKAEVTVYTCSSLITFN